MLSYTDDVQGQVIGTYYGAAWICYNGRKQGKTFYVENEIEALSKCEQAISEYKNMSWAKDVYPDESLWSIHMDGV